MRDLFIFNVAAHFQQYSECQLPPRCWTIGLSVARIRLCVGALLRRGHSATCTIQWCTRLMSMCKRTATEVGRWHVGVELEISIQHANEVDGAKYIRFLRWEQWIILANALISSVQYLCDKVGFSKMHFTIDNSLKYIRNSATTLVIGRFCLCTSAARHATAALTIGCNKIHVIMNSIHRHLPSFHDDTD